MARVRIEWVRLGSGPDSAGGGWMNTIEETYGTPMSLEVTGAATAAGSRPTAPAFGSYSRGHARILSDSAVVVARGEDPTAALNVKGNYVAAGGDVVLPAKAGDKFSFILAPAL